MEAGGLPITFRFVSRPVWRARSRDLHRSATRAAHPGVTQILAAARTAAPKERVSETAASMYGVIRQYKIDPEEIGAIVRHCRDPFLPGLSKTLGFVSWTLMDAGSDLITLSIFDDELEADNAAGWYRENQAALELGKPRVTRGPIVVHHVQEHVPAGYGLFWRHTFNDAGAERAMRHLRDGFGPLIAGMPHFASYEVLDAGACGCVSLCAFKNKESAEAANGRTAAWVNENLAGSVSGSSEFVIAEIRLRTSRHAKEDGSAVPLHAEA
jgi:hypothetical protein